MSEPNDKVPFASPAWVEIARAVLVELVAQHGQPGERYSIYEAFVDAPPAISDADGCAAWYFRVDGKHVEVGIGRPEDVDIKVQATWEISLPGARLVYTPELLAQWAQNPPKPPPDPNRKIDGDMGSLPSYLTELHNRLAVLTE